jgi:hypothetical protein
MMMDVMEKTIIIKLRQLLGTTARVLVSTKRRATIILGLDGTVTTGRPARDVVRAWGGRLFAVQAAST